MQIAKYLRMVVVAVGMAAGMYGTAQAQRFYWGPRVGLNISTVTKTTYAKARARASFGLMAGYKINDLIGLQAEALYSLQGYQMTNSPEKYSYNYIKIPVLAKLYLIGGLNIEAGVSFNWLVRAQSKEVNVINESGTVVTSQDLLGSSKPFDLSIPVGLNYQFSRLFDIGVRYDISTVRIPDERKNHAKNGNWSINLGLRF